MGSVITPCSKRRIAVEVHAAGAIDSVDVIKNNALVHRVSQTDIPAVDIGDTLRTLIYLELGWGERNRAVNWDVDLSIYDGTIIRYEPRFRGREVVSPVEGDEAENGFYESHWETNGDRAVHFTTATRSNPNNSTNASQGFCLEIEAPLTATVEATLNGHIARFPLRDLIAGARTGHLGGIDSPAFRFHRAPQFHEFHWNFNWTDQADGEDNYYLRVRQRNDQWAWSSPVFLRNQR
jgi:hypothetical protein